MGVLVRNRVGNLRGVVQTTTADMKDLGLLARERILLRQRAVVGQFVAVTQVQARERFQSG